MLYNIQHTEYIIIVSKISSLNNLQLFLLSRIIIPIYYFYIIVTIYLYLNYMSHLKYTLEMMKLHKKNQKMFYMLSGAFKFQHYSQGTKKKCIRKQIKY